MAFSPRYLIDWHLLGSRLRAIDFHFLYMIVAPQSNALWDYMRLDGVDVIVAGNASRVYFAAAARFIGQRRRAGSLRQCDHAHIRSQVRRVGQIFASLEREGIATRSQIQGRKCKTTLRLPTIGGAK